MPNVVYFRGGKRQARELIHSLSGMLTGRNPDTLGIAQGVFLSIGFAALGDIQRDYVVKARKGTGEDGVKWEPLKPETIARRRLGPKDKKLPHIAERLAKEKEATKAAKAAFEAQAKARLKKLDEGFRPLVHRFMLSLPDDAAVARAKQVMARRKALLRAEIDAERKAADFALRGKLAVTRDTGQTRASVLSQRDVEILRDTGVGLASLSQGVLSHKGPGATYTKPTSAAKTRLGSAKREGGEQQIFETMKDGIIVGTNVPYMKDHQEGDPSRNLPARPFLPEKVPPAWAERWAATGLEALQAGVNLLFQAG
jgi:hypothetical protein